MLTIHHLGMSQSERIVWLCEELGLDYALKRYERRSDTMMAPDEYKALHPMGIAPTITDGDVALGETAAIAEYLTIKYGEGRLVPPQDSPHFIDHLYWHHFANGTMMLNMLAKMALAMAGVPDSPAAAFLNDRRDRMWAMIEDHLARLPFFGGEELTTADIMMAYPLRNMRKLPTEKDAQRPHTDAYLARIAARPAYQRAMTKAEPG